MKKLLALASVLSVLALVACGSSSSSTVNSCVVVSGGKTAECVQYPVAVTLAECQSQAVGYGDTAGVKITTATSCPAGDVAHCAWVDSASKKTIMTYYGYDSTAITECKSITSM